MIKGTFLAGLIGLVALLASCDGQPAMASPNNCLLDADVCGALTGLDEENYNFIGNGFNIQDIAANGNDVTADADGIAVLVHKNGLGQAGVFTPDNFERVAFAYGDSFVEFDVDDTNSFIVDWDYNNPPQVLLTDVIIRVGVSQSDRREIPEPRVWIALAMITAGLGITYKGWK